MRAAVAMTFAFVLVAPVSGYNLDVTAESSLSFDEEAAKKTPIDKVKKLIQDMLTEMEKEAGTDKEINEKMICWCETNTKEKTKTIADAEARISDLTSSIEMFTATSLRLNTEVKNLQKEIAEDQKSLDTATALRAKQLKEFTAEEQNLVQTIGSLTSATTVMAGSGSKLTFLQLQQSRFVDVATAVQNAMEKHASLLVGVLTHSERKAVAAFIQAPAYAPQGGEILGILNQMKETFEANLGRAQKDETTNQQAYEELKAAKEGEIAAGQEQADSKTQELSETDLKNAQAKEDLKDTSKTLAADQKFMKMLKDKCALSAADYAQRTKDRHEEVTACDKAFKMLNSDDAHDLFGKSLGFVQTESSMHSERRTEASKLLSEVAMKLHNPRLASLAIRTRKDVFAKVKKSIDDMVVALNEQKAEEIKKNDFCIAELNKQDLQKERTIHSKEDASAKIVDLKGNLKELTQAIAQLNADIAEMQKEMKYAGDDREKENKEFQMTVADQRATQKLLKSVLNVLKGFYNKDKKAAAVLVQGEQPAAFDKHKKNAKGTGLVGMLQQIIWDAEATEAEALRSEADSQRAYESLVKNTNDSIDAKSRNIVNKSAAKSKAESDLVENNSDHKRFVTFLDNVAKSQTATHASCDFVVKNFDVRQSAKTEEVEALQQAKAILSGSKFSALMQSSN